MVRADPLPEARHGPPDEDADEYRTKPEPIFPLLFLLVSMMFSVGNP
jgi:hypothetical protein